MFNRCQIVISSNELIIVINIAFAVKNLKSFNFIKETHIHYLLVHSGLEFKLNMNYCGSKMEEKRFLCYSCTSVCTSIFQYMPPT